MISTGEERSGVRLRHVLILTVAMLSLPLAVFADKTADYRILRAKVRVLCPLTVGGGFEATTTSLTGVVSVSSAGTLSGDLSVDLRSLDTGISLRNEHLRGKYLEVDKAQGYDRAVLKEIRLGDADPSTVQGHVAFSGVLTLHGVEKRIDGHATIEREAGTIRIEADFPVILGEFGIEKPQYLGIGVKSEVQVKVSLTAAPAEGKE